MSPPSVAGAAPASWLFLGLGRVGGVGPAECWRNRARGAVFAHIRLNYPGSTTHGSAVTSSDRRDVTAFTVGGEGRVVEPDVLEHGATDPVPSAPGGLTAPM